MPAFVRLATLPSFLQQWDRQRPISAEPQQISFPALRGNVVELNLLEDKKKGPVILIDALWVDGIIAKTSLVAHADASNPLRADSIKTRIAVPQPGIHDAVSRACTQSSCAREGERYFRVMWTPAGYGTLV